MSFGLKPQNLSTILSEDFLYYLNIFVCLTWANTEIWGPVTDYTWIIFWNPAFTVQSSAVL